MSEDADKAPGDIGLFSADSLPTCRSLICRGFWIVGKCPALEDELLMMGRWEAYGQLDETRSVVARPL